MHDWVYSRIPNSEKFIAGAMIISFGFGMWLAMEGAIMAVYATGWHVKLGFAMMVVGYTTAIGGPIWLGKVADEKGLPSAEEVSADRNHSSLEG